MTENMYYQDATVSVGGSATGGVPISYIQVDSENLQVRHIQFRYFMFR